jgi:hypothetical protein
LTAGIRVVITSRLWHGPRRATGGASLPLIGALWLQIELAASWKFAALDSDFQVPGQPAGRDAGFMANLKGPWAQAMQRLPVEIRGPARPVLLTDLPVKGQIFHREAENRLFRRPREAKKTSILNEF